MYHFDVIGRPIKLNDRVLVKGYYCVGIGKTLGTITKINKKSIIVTVDDPFYKYSYDWDAPRKKETRLPRHGNDCLVVTARYLKEADRELTKFTFKHPEMFI